MIELIIAALVIIPVLWIWRRIKMLTSGTGLGARLTGGHESDESAERRKESYVRGVSRETKEQAKKILKKADKTRSKRKRSRLLEEHNSLVERSAWQETFAWANVKSFGEKGHGVRKAGTERGRKVVATKR